MIIAHIKKNDDGWAEPQTLDEHLRGTAELAEHFAASLGAGQWGRVLGLCHDTGKARGEWQQYIRTSSGYDEEASLEIKKGKMDHSGRARGGGGVFRLWHGAYSLVLHRRAHAGFPTGQAHRVLLPSDWSMQALGKSRISTRELLANNKPESHRGN